jgi:hypothetical protein
MRRLIDIKRDSGGSFKLPEGSGPIVAMKGLGDRMLIVAQHAVYTLQLADRIDPGRTNVAVPKAVERNELHRGAVDEVVAWTLCAAIEVLDQTHLPVGFPVEPGMAICLRIAKQLSDVEDEADAIAAIEVATRAAMEEKGWDPSRLPATPKLAGQVEHAITQARRSLVDLASLTELFHPRRAARARWHDAFETHVATGVDPFTDGLKGMLSRIDRVHNFRNALIHPDATKRVDVYGYELLADLSMVAPTIEIQHKDTPLARQDVVHFLRNMGREVAWIVEAFISALATLSARQFAPFMSRVVVLPEGQERAGSRIAWEITMPEGFALPQPATSNAQERLAGAPPRPRVSP